MSTRAAGKQTTRFQVASRFINLPQVRIDDPIEVPVSPIINLPPVYINPADIPVNPVINLPVIPIPPSPVTPVELPSSETPNPSIEPVTPADLTGYPFATSYELAPKVVPVEPITPNDMYNTFNYPTNIAPNTSVNTETSFPVTVVEDPVPVATPTLLSTGTSTFPNNTPVSYDTNTVDAGYTSILAKSQTQVEVASTTLDAGYETPPDPGLSIGSEYSPGSAMGQVEAVTAILPGATDVNSINTYFPSSVAIETNTYSVMTASGATKEVTKVTTTPTFKEEDTVVAPVSTSQSTSTSSAETTVPLNIAEMGAPVPMGMEKYNNPIEVSVAFGDSEQEAVPVNTASKTTSEASAFVEFPVMFSSGVATAPTEAVAVETSTVGSTSAGDGTTVSAADVNSTGALGLLNSQSGATPLNLNGKATEDEAAIAVAMFGEGSDVFSSHDLGTPSSPMLDLNGAPTGTFDLGSIGIRAAPRMEAKRAKNFGYISINGGKDSNGNALLINLQYFPETVKINRRRNNTAEATPYSNKAFTHDVSFDPVTFSFSTLFNDYFEYKSTKSQYTIGRICQGTELDIDTILQPELYGYEGVWTLDLGYEPFLLREVLIDNIDVEESFMSPDTNQVGRLQVNIQGKFYNRVEVPNAIFRKPPGKPRPPCEMKKVERYECVPT